MATTSPPPSGARAPTRSPSAGMEFHTPTRPAGPEPKQPGDSASPPSPSNGGSQTSGAKLQQPRARAKSTSELLSAYEDLQAQAHALEAQIRDRKTALETECYTALGSVLFERRDDEQIAGVYQSIAASLGVRMLKKLDELGRIPSIAD